MPHIGWNLEITCIILSRYQDVRVDTLTRQGWGKGAGFQGLNIRAKAPYISPHAGLFLIFRNRIKFNCHSTAYGLYAFTSSYLIL